jgi:hypothetical protein
MWHSIFWCAIPPPGKGRDITSRPTGHHCDHCPTQGHHFPTPTGHHSDARPPDITVITFPTHGTSLPDPRDITVRPTGHHFLPGGGMEHHKVESHIILKIWYKTHRLFFYSVFLWKSVSAQFEPPFTLKNPKLTFWCSNIYLDFYCLWFCVYFRNFSYVHSPIVFSSFHMF